MWLGKGCELGFEGFDVIDESFGGLFLIGNDLVCFLKAMLLNFGLDFFFIGSFELLRWEGFWSGGEGSLMKGVDNRTLIQWEVELVV